MTRSRLLSGILISLFVIVVMILMLLLRSGLMSQPAPTQSANPSPYLLETTPNPAY